MGLLGPRLQEELLKLIHSCYASEKILSELNKQASDKELQAYIQHCSTWYGEFANHLRLVIASVNVSAALNMELSPVMATHWIDVTNAKDTDSDSDILRIVLDCHINALCQFKEIKNQQQSVDIAFVLEKGQAGILDYFKKGQSLSNTKK